ncbi:MAG: thioredoxin domain-containing protein, partial [Devosiaceae bacterium]|nr:thioredoxin domain-containing protein [Devosiaceae bacterium]
MDQIRQTIHKICAFAIPLIVSLIVVTTPAQAQVTSDNPHNRAPNNLLGVASPYLQQHVYNAVNWYPWGQEALAKAREENKPVFLSVGYSTCHWCRVMAEESFEDEIIGAFINEHFIAIKIDRERRPDLDEK